MARSDLQAALAAHRFGLGEAALAGVGSDPQGWLIAQLGPAEAQRGADLASGVEGVRRFADFLAAQRRAGAATGSAPMAGGEMAASPGVSPTDTRPAEQPFGEHFRAIVQADVRARLRTATQSTQPFNERLALFWANHFTVSMAKASARGVVGAFEREAIRPHIGGSFEGLLKAVVTHAGMLRYLDNDSSAGPQSPFVRRQLRRPRAANEPAPRITGLNENLAREVLELHTLGAVAAGAPGGYTQADVTEFARVLTGWRVALAEVAQAPPGSNPVRFDAAWHEPGPKTVLGKRYAEGPEALASVLHDLALHPATARFIATKLARHFVADDPPPALVSRLEARYRDTGGDLGALARALVQSPEAWSPQAAKLKTPEEFVISSVRLLGLSDADQTAWLTRQPDAGIGPLGQRVQAAPSPAGWPDRAEEWLGPDAVWKRVEWATRVADRLGRTMDARALAQASLGPLLTEDTQRQIERAADGPQALALLLMSPEFQRR